MEGYPSKRQGIFLGRNWDGCIETVYRYPDPERFMSQLFHLAQRRCHFWVRSQQSHNALQFRK